MNIINTIITGILPFLFGGKRNVVTEIAEQFSPSAEKSEERGADNVEGARQQFAAEFNGRDGILNDLVDFANRIPRPAISLLIIWLFIYTSINPEEAAVIFANWGRIPIEAWSLMGIVITFFFGGRMLHKKR